VSVDLEHEKRLAARAAAALAEDGMRIGLGTGSTAAYFVEELAGRQLDVRCVSTSPATEASARARGLQVDAFDGTGALARLDLAVDGADQVAPDRWLVKGGGAAHTREKIVAAAADRFVVVVSSDKLVDRLHAPVPLELLRFGLAATLEQLGPVRVRDTPASPDGGVIADWHGELDDPRELAGRLEAVPGVVAHGLFPPELVSEVVVGRGEGVETL
jgi:ribose 5-phosphate isomerase A